MEIQYGKEELLLLYHATKQNLDATVLDLAVVENAAKKIVAKLWHQRDEDAEYMEREALILVDKVKDLECNKQSLESMLQTTTSRCRKLDEANIKLTNNYEILVNDIIQFICQDSKSTSDEIEYLAKEFDVYIREVENATNKKIVELRHPEYMEREALILVDKVKDLECNRQSLESMLQTTTSKCRKLDEANIKLKSDCEILESEVMQLRKNTVHKDRELKETRVELEKLKEAYIKLEELKIRNAMELSALHEKTLIMQEELQDQYTSVLVLLDERNDLELENREHIEALNNAMRTIADLKQELEESTNLISSNQVSLDMTTSTPPSLLSEILFSETVAAKNVKDFGKSEDKHTRKEEPPSPSDFVYELNGWDTESLEQIKSSVEQEYECESEEETSSKTGVSHVLERMGGLVLETTPKLPKWIFNLPKRLFLDLLSKPTTRSPFSNDPHYGSESDVDTDDIEILQHRLQRSTEALKSEVNEMENEMSKFVNLSEKLKSDYLLMVEEKDCEISSLRKELAGANITISQLKAELCEWSENKIQLKLVEVQSELANEQRINCDHKAKIVELEEKLASSVTSNEYLETILVNLDSEIVSMQDEILNVHKTLATLQAENKLTSPTGDYTGKLLPELNNRDSDSAYTTLTVRRGKRRLNINRDGQALEEAVKLHGFLRQVHLMLNTFADAMSEKSTYFMSQLEIIGGYLDKALQQKLDLRDLLAKFQETE